MLIKIYVNYIKMLHIFSHPFGNFFLNLIYIATGFSKMLIAALAKAESATMKYNKTFALKSETRISNTFQTIKLKSDTC